MKNIKSFRSHVGP